MLPPQREGENCQPELRDRWGQRWDDGAGDAQGGRNDLEEGGWKGQGQTRCKDSAKGMGEKKMPEHLCRGTSWHPPLEQKRRVKKPKMTKKKTSLKRMLGALSQQGMQEPQGSGGLSSKVQEPREDTGNERC